MACTSDAAGVFVPGDDGDSQAQRPRPARRRAVFLWITALFKCSGAESPHDSCYPER
jgi:hypothetical protein